MLGGLDRLVAIAARIGPSHAGAENARGHAREPAPLRGRPGVEFLHVEVQVRQQGAPIQGGGPGKGAGMAVRGKGYELRASTCTRAGSSRMRS